MLPRQGPGNVGRPVSRPPLPVDQRPPGPHDWPARHPGCELILRHLPSHLCRVPLPEEPVSLRPKLAFPRFHSSSAEPLCLDLAIRLLNTGSFGGPFQGEPFDFPRRHWPSRHLARWVATRRCSRDRRIVCGTPAVMQCDGAQARGPHPPQGRHCWPGRAGAARQAMAILDRR